MLTFPLEITSSSDTFNSNSPNTAVSSVLLTRSVLVFTLSSITRIQAGQLDNVPRRYAWFRRILKHHDDEDAALFPSNWEVTRRLVASFAEYTRGDLANVLGKAVPNVNAVLEALQSTLDFENAFAKRFDRSVRQLMTQMRDAPVTHASSSRM